MSKIARAKTINTMALCGSFDPLLLEDGSHAISVRQINQLFDQTWKSKDLRFFIGKDFKLTRGWVDSDPGIVEALPQEQFEMLLHRLAHFNIWMAMYLLSQIERSKILFLEALGIEYNRRNEYTKEEMGRVDVGLQQLNSLLETMSTSDAYEEFRRMYSR
jgi:hypothetical protein